LIYILEATLLMHAHNIGWESSTTSLFIFIPCYYFL